MANARVGVTVRRECSNREYFTKSQAKSLCPRENLASYSTIVSDSQINPDAARYYPVECGNRESMLLTCEFMARTSSM